MISNKRNHRDRWQRIKNDVVSFFSESTIPGLKYVVESRIWLERITWGAFLILSFWCTGWILLKQMQYWDSHPVETTIDEVGLPVDQLPFPAITVCDTASLKMPRKNQWMFVEKLLNSLELIEPNEISEKMYPSNACPMNQFRCSYGACIPITWACDGINDCGDESDENTHCVFKNRLTDYCPSSHFRCGNERCINLSMVCNGENDCGDNTDETVGCDEWAEFTTAMTTSTTTTPGCITNGGNENNERCVFPFIYKGVTYRSCTSKDDNNKWCYTEVDANANGVEGKWGYCSPECEGDGIYVRKNDTFCNPNVVLNSTNLTTAKEECEKDPSCFHFYDRCGNGTQFKYCGKGDEEISSSCGSILFTKDTNQCLNTDEEATDKNGDNCESWYDENPADCGRYDDDDFSARIMCCACQEAGLTCQVGEFVCKNKQCIQVNKTCDFINDCGDWSDEYDCSGFKGCCSCDRHQFLCNNKVCIPNLWKCNGKNDCGDNSDELLDTCEEEGGCQTKDSDACLQASPGWDTSSTCQSSTYKCKSWGKDMMRCCPESCTSWYIDQGDFEVLGSYTGIFKEKDCETFGILNPFSNGTCTYPNEAQCSVDTHYKKIEGKFCIDTFDSFSNLTAAENVCSQEFMCKGVNDQKCDGSEFTLCMIGYEYSDATGFLQCAVYDKKENVKTIHENEKFVCASGSELDFTFVCDGKKEKDCGSDEGTVCSGAICSTEMISCDGNKCIPPHKLCDGENDCDDGLDEQGNCTTKYCKTELNRRCDIPFDYKGQKYATCIDSDNEGQPWCYTEKTWDNCKASSCPELKEDTPNRASSLFALPAIMRRVMELLESHNSEEYQGLTEIRNWTRTQCSAGIFAMYHADTTSTADLVINYILAKKYFWTCHCLESSDKCKSILLFLAKSGRFRSNAISNVLDQELRLTYDSAFTKDFDSMIENVLYPAFLRRFRKRIENMQRSFLDETIYKSLQKLLQNYFQPLNDLITLKERGNRPEERDYFRFVERLRFKSDYVFAMDTMNTILQNFFRGSHTLKKYMQKQKQLPSVSRRRHLGTMVANFNFLLKENRPGKPTPAFMGIEKDLAKVGKLIIPSQKLSLIEILRLLGYTHDLQTKTNNENLKVQYAKCKHNGDTTCIDKYQHYIEYLKKKEYCDIESLHQSWRVYMKKILGTFKGNTTKLKGKNITDEEGHDTLVDEGNKFRNGTEINPPFKPPCFDNHPSKCCQILNDVFENVQKVMALMKHSLESTDSLIHQIKEDQFGFLEKIHQDLVQNQLGELTPEKTILGDWRFPRNQHDNMHNDSAASLKGRNILPSRLIPICGLLHPDDVLEADDISSGILKRCSEFVPSFSNTGLCLTRNGYKMDQLFKHTPHLETFKETFLPKNVKHSVENISKKQSEYHFTLIVDGNRYNNFKRGKNWNNVSLEKIKIGIHSPDEIADIRGWYNKIIRVATGHITTIKVKPSKQQSEELIKNVPITHRKCKFQSENEEFSSMQNYTQVHCRMECKMKLAEKMCGCRPWDYPDKEQQNVTYQDKHTYTLRTYHKETKLCDYFGKSCFDKILRREGSQECENSCLPNCNKISYSIDISEKPIDLNNRICDLNVKSPTQMESMIKEYVFEVLERNGSAVRGNGLFPSPEFSLINKLKDILKSKRNQSTALEDDCRRKLENDISVIVVSIDSPTYSRTMKGVKATTLDKLAYVGSYMGMLTGIRVLTLVELAFWFVRLFSRRCFRSSSTDVEKPAPRPSQKDERMDALEKEISLIKTNMSMKSKPLWKRKNRQLTVNYIKR